MKLKKDRNKEESEMKERKKTTGHLQKYMYTADVVFVPFFHFRLCLVSTLFQIHRLLSEMKLLKNFFEFPFSFEAFLNHLLKR